MCGLYATGIKMSVKNTKRFLTLENLFFLKRYENLISSNFIKIKKIFFSKCGMKKRLNYIYRMWEKLFKKYKQKNTSEGFPMHRKKNGLLMWRPETDGSELRNLSDKPAKM